MRPARWRTGRGDTPHDRGAAAVEFAIVLTVLLVIILGIIDFGRLLFVKQGVTSASREGARAAAVGALGPDVLAKVEDSGAAAQALSAGGPLIVTYARNGGTTFTDLSGEAAALCGASDESVEVRVLAKFTWLTPLGVFTGGGLNGVWDVDSSTIMRCET